MGDGLKFALALGSGGARGYAHLGAAQEIRARGHEIVAIAGTSMGALVGGVIAADIEQPFTEWAYSVKQRDRWRLIDPAWSSGGAMSADRLLADLERLLDGTLIEDLPIPYTAVATDLEARREVWFQRGPIVPAIRASIAIPGLFAPSVIDGRVLVDGGLMNPLPIDPTAASPADVTLAVSLNGPRTAREPATPTRESSQKVTQGDWKDELLGRMRKSFPGRGKNDVEGHDDAAESDLRIADVVSLSFDAMQGLITRYRTAGHPPDVMVTIPLSAARTLDFHRAEELVALGRVLTAEALDEAGL